MDGGLLGPKKIIMKLHARRGHASAQQLKRVLVDSGGGSMHSLTHVDGVSERCEVRHYFGKAPHVPPAGTSTAPMFNEKLQANPAFLGDLIAFRAMDVFSKYLLVKPVRSKNPHEVRGVMCNSRVGVFGQPRSIRMDEGGEWKHQVRTDSLLGGR